MAPPPGFKTRKYLDQKRLKQVSHNTDFAHANDDKDWFGSCLVVCVALFFVVQFIKLFIWPVLEGFWR